MAQAMKDCKHSWNVTFPYKPMPQFENVILLYCSKCGKCDKQKKGKIRK